MMQAILGRRWFLLTLAVALAVLGAVLVAAPPSQAVPPSNTAAPGEVAGPEAEGTAAVVPMAATSAAFTSIRPVRVADTRPGQPTAFPVAEEPIPAGGTLEVPVAGTNGIPADAAAVVANVTAITPTGRGHLRVFPCGQPRPSTSTLNYSAGVSMANASVVAPGSGGRVCVYTPTTTHVIVDISGYFPAGSPVNPIAPVRLADTRPGHTVSFPSPKGPLPANTSLLVPAAGTNGIPADAAALILNVAATDSEGGGHLRATRAGPACLRTPPS